jgi:hypothetical protein
MNEPICVQGIDATTAVIGAILFAFVGSVLASAAWWVVLLRAPMPSVWPVLSARWRKPLTWPSVLSWAWIVIQEIWRHTARKARQVRDNALAREVDGTDPDATVQIPPHPHRTRRYRTGGRHV